MFGPREEGVFHVEGNRSRRQGAPVDRPRIGCAGRFGIRLVPQPDKPGTLMMEILEEPEAGDDVVEESGLRIFVPDELAHELSDRTLDIGVTEQGVALTLR